MKMHIIYIFCLLFYSCSINFDVDTHNSKDSENEKEIKLPNDVRWVIKSPEYQILCKQIYENAWNNLSEIFTQSIEQSAIIMDLDETVLDNSKYQITLIEKNESYNPESWSLWVNLQEAELVPGAKEFIDSIRKTNVRIIFLSNRMAINELPTIENMKRLNIYNDEDIFLLRIDKADKKDIRRAEVINGTGRMETIGAMKVLAYFGDGHHDFPNQNENYIFGRNMFMFPNPMYGKW